MNDSISDVSRELSNKQNSPVRKSPNFGKENSMNDQGFNKDFLIYR